MTIHLPGLLFALAAVSAHSENVRGADVGWLSQMEASGKLFRDRQGRPDDLLRILKDEGINGIRLRVWVDPKDGWCGKADVVKTAVRARRMGFRIMIDFHYSDSWADPGQQTKPAAWSSHSIESLKNDVASHTVDVLKTLRDSGVAPEWVQVGNETNDGMLWEEGRASKNMANFAALVQSGSKAVKSVFPEAKVVVHISNGFDNSLFRWIFDGLKKNGVEWDVVGMSLYPEPDTWRDQEARCASNMKDMVARYGKKVMISEVGMGWTAADSAYALIKKLQADVASLPDASGLGVFYWEPQCYGGWNGYQKGAFDADGKPTHAMDAFRELATSGIHIRQTESVTTESGVDALGRHLPPLRHDGSWRLAHRLVAPEE